MSKRFFDYDPLTGTRSYFESGEGDTFVIHQECDVTPILEENARKRSAGRDYYAKDKDMWRLASVPNILLLKWAQELGVPGDKVFSDEFAEIVGKRLNDLDYRKLKTADVRI